MKWNVFFLLFFPIVVYASNYPVKVGDTTVIIKQQLGKGKSFVHLHQNETTALKAAKHLIKMKGGSLLTLIHPGERNIVFRLHQSRYEFDPNRIFTDIGIKKTLMKFGSYTPAAHQEVKKLADKIKILLPKGKIIAVHNNQSYSIKDYLPGNNLSKDAIALHVNDSNYFRNFYLVTQKNEYARLKKLRFNGILQAPNAIDDGSLSVYLAKRDYVNVEAGYDQLSAQIDMLRHA